MLKSLGQGVHLKGILAHRRDIDREYLMSLRTDNLLLPFYQEAALVWITYMPKDLHGGWDSPLSQIRGTVCGHFLSSAAHIVLETGDLALKAKADHIVSEIARCQRENGNGWCFPIPEKYLRWLKKGKHTWAPHYVCHKTMMGLLDMYRFAGNEPALEIVKAAAEWFYAYTEDITPEQMIAIMHEETGGIMELFADLYAVTGDERHLTLMRRYERKELYALLESGENPLVNMHANATVPEIHGAARAYEVTGEERYRSLVERYWEIAVDQLGMFVTGGQTSGEVWLPKERQAARLGNMNQEHCVVYNMMRLADYLFRWTGEAKYADYWEKNLYNGIFAQGFWQEDKWDATGGDPNNSDRGYVAYYLPLHARAQKIWGTATDNFWCCHCTLMQANASFPESVFYADFENRYVAVGQYQEADAVFSIDGVNIEIKQCFRERSGAIVKIDPINREVLKRPSDLQVSLQVKTERPVSFSLGLRIPEWVAGDMAVSVDEGVSSSYTENGNGFALIEREWDGETEVLVTLPKKITTWPLYGEDGTVAFLDGPVALAGVDVGEKCLYYQDKPEDILVPYDERRWSSWQRGWKTVGQEENFVLKPIFEIGRETYTTYFPVKQVAMKLN